MTVNIQQEITDAKTTLISYPTLGKIKQRCAPKTP